MKNLDFYIEKALENIENDRATTKVLLTDAMIYLKKNEENHKTTGPVVAKYLETLQRSNEQLVKLAQILQRTSKEEVNITDFDRMDIFDQIQNSDEKETI